ncbi:MAG: glycosyltransferase [Vulcanimicrobiota bacterium]
MLRQVLRRLGLPHRMLAARLLQRRAGSLRNKHRHCFTAFNLMDLGTPPAVQYVHHPSPPPQAAVNPWPDNPWMRIVWPYYLMFLDLLFRPSQQRIRQNISVTNSYWTARAIKSQGVSNVKRVLYPPVLGKPVGHASDPRKFGFISIGRLAPEKNWVDLIHIIEGVRSRGHEVSLSLAGSRYHQQTLDNVQAMLEERKDWLTLLLDPPRTVLDRAIAEHRYGIHGMRDEHYGMAVAELVLGGCLTFVHDSGGQVEIVPQPEVRYQSIEDAVEMISGVLADPTLQEDLLARQSEHARHFTRQRFVDDFGQFVEELESGREIPCLDLGATS